MGKMAAFATSVLLLALQIAFGQAKKCNTGFSVVAPEVAVPGKTTAILVTLYGRDKDDTEPLNVTVKLEAQEVDDEAKLLTEASQMITSYGIIALKIPPSPSGHCTLHTTVGCNRSEECTSRSHSAIRLLGPVRDVIVRPARHHYRPGEMLTFWILALDHDLRLAQGELAKVAVSDPAGTKVAIWEELSLDEGVRKLSLMLAAGATTGSWHVEAHCGGASATVEITVSAATGNSVPASSAAEQHYVELRFADNMRRRYKPGLPFVGRVKAMSTEKRVRVRVKLYDDKTDIYSQDIDMSTGEGSFIVPTVIAEAPYINLQAELVAVEGKEIETHYVLAKEKIHRWNSTSKCYLLVENLPTPMQVGDVASATVWSSCGCHEQLLAAITSGGRAVHWATVSAINVTEKMCSYNHTFPITADMAPISSLLVYYVTGAGEPVSDVASFHVKLLHKEVAIAVEERRWWYPRAALQLRVVAPSDSKMCLIGARTPTDSKFDGHHSASSEHEDQPGPEFVSAGVSLFVGGGDCGGGGGVLYRQRTTPAPKSPAHLVPPSHHDRLWMWKCFNYTSQLSTDGVTIAAPSEAGRWSIWALSLSSRGLRFSSPKTINVFRPIQLDFSLPPALRVGETVEVDVKITNNINNCMDVTALLAVSSGANFASTGALFVTERLRLGPRGGTQLVVRVAVNTPGRKNITVEITGYGADNCSVSYTSFSNESLVGSVIRSANVLVVPEGLQRTDTQSAYFCANEHLAVSSRGSWEWKWVPAPRNRAGLVLEFRAQGSAHIALSSAKETSDDMYRVVFEKTKVWIARGKHGYDVHLASAEQTDTDDDCTQDSWCSCWVWWEGGRLSVGRGAVPSERRLLVWPLAQDVKIKFVGFSALWGDKADFRIWNFNEEAGFSQVLELGLPHGVVPGSANGNLLISGGLHLPLYTFQPESNEQWESVWRDSQLSAAAARLAPLLALEHIPHLVGENERENILKRLPEQVQILLSFRKSDNSFSEHPAVSSHASTVQILEILSKIQSYYPIDPELLQSTKKWIQARQNPDGSYTPLSVDKEVDYYVSDVKKVNLTERDATIDEYYYYDKDGSMSKEEMEKEKRVEVTAETLATLLEVGVENQKDADVAKKAQVYLEKNFHKLTSPASLAATVLALILSRSTLVPEALALLRNASTTEEGEFGWPPPRKDAADWLFDDNSKTIKTTSYEAVTLEQYIAAVRVLLAACARGALSEGEAAARFLYYRASTLQRHPNIAYSATKAAAQFAALAHDRHRDLTISLATAGMELTDTLELQAKTHSKALQLPGLPTKVFVYATGAGCATVQGSSTYSTYIPKPENTLLALDSGIIEEIRPERSSIEDLQGNLPTLNIKTCFKWKGKEKSGILRLEVSLFSGYELHSVNPVVLDGPVHADLHYGSRGESVWFVFANITSVCPVCVTYQVKSRFVVTSLRPAFAKIYPSTRPDLAVETFFHASSGSPLLKGITDDDFITWFDKTVVLSLLNSTNVNDICECGRVCKKAKNNAGNVLKNKAGVNKTNDMKHVKKAKEISVVSNEIAEKITESNILKPAGISQTIEAATSTLPTLVNANESAENMTIVESKNQTTNSQYNDDPIIIPTATYDNSTSISNHSDDNQIPLISEGALIVQKDPALKRNVTTIKSLPRRKGTLKSTYGDKHEKIIKDLLNSTPTPKPTNIKNNLQKTLSPKTDIGTKTILNNSSKFIPKTIQALEKLTTTAVIMNTTATPISKPNKQENIPTVSTESKISQSPPREIISITNSNLNTIVFHRTKKPKSRILKPVYIPNSNNTNLSQQISTNQAKPIQYNTKTEIMSKPDTNERPAKKSKKSVNKEIGELPPKPISETTKILEETQKPETVPDNRKGFEILDKKPNGVSKEHALDILKDKSNTAKIDDLSYKINLQQQNISSLNSTRSL